MGSVSYRSMTDFWHAMQGHLGPATGGRPQTSCHKALRTGKANLMHSADFCWLPVPGWDPIFVAWQHGFTVLTVSL